MIQNEEDIVINTQVVQVFVNVFTSKLKVDLEIVQVLCHDLEANFQIFNNNFQSITNALEIRRRYEFSFWDSLIISAAQYTGCNMLLSEDLQHLQKIEGITVKNPFV